MTSVPRHWSQSRESLPDCAYEEISDEFLEGAFHPDGHKEMIKESRPNTGIYLENQYQMKGGSTKVYVEGVENKDPKVLKKARDFAKSVNDQLAPLNEVIRSLVIDEGTPLM